MSVGSALISKKYDSAERRELFEKWASCASNDTLIVGQVVHVTASFIFVKSFQEK